MTLDLSENQQFVIFGTAVSSLKYVSLMLDQKELMKDEE